MRNKRTEKLRHKQRKLRQAWFTGKLPERLRDKDLGDVLHEAFGGAHVWDKWSWSTWKGPVK